MSLYWGVIPISCEPTNTHDDELEFAARAVQIRENAPNGSRAVVIGGVSVGKPGSTSVLEIRELNRA
jgi:pyruvate kinase